VAARTKNKEGLHALWLYDSRKEMEGRKWLQKGTHF
jgi:hypothetical protein